MNIIWNEVTRFSQIVAIVLFVGVFFLGVWVGIQFEYVNNAHTSLENYSKFRGCTELVEKADTYAICKLPKGEKIKLIKVNDKWYLDGDGPGVF